MYRNFVSLSLEWLEKYVSVEPADLEIINDPYRTILTSGGNIFFTKHNNGVIGTVVMIKQGNNEFELAKLGITESYKGQKIGNLLMKKCLDFAESCGAGRIILYTNRILVSAINLYKKFGFVEVSLFQNKYIEV